jgi:hypothetical protein
MTGALSAKTLTGRVLSVFVLLADQRRRVVHLAITDHPTAAWTAKQIREAFPDDTVTVTLDVPDALE